ncbi:MAG: glycosyltransferase family 4 protein, partial [Desulfofustis sp.]
QDVLFVLVGYPKHAVEKHIGRTGVGDRVILPGEVDYAELGLWLASADLAVDPKISGSGEASGKILHYMAAGLPVVCFDTENNRAFLGEHAFYPAAVSSPDLAAAIDLALTDPESRLKYGAFCRTMVQKNFSIDSVGRQLDRLYHQFER